MVTAGAVVAAVLVLGVVVSTWQWFRADRERERAVINEGTARKAQAELANQRAAEQEARRFAEQQAYAANINLAHQAWKESNLGRVRWLLAKTRPKPGEEDLRGWEWRYLWGLSRGDDLGEVARFDGGVWHLACAEDGQLIAVGLLGKAAEEKAGFLYDLAADRLVSRRKFATNWLSGAVFLPRSGRLLSNRPDARGRPGISVLEARSLHEVARLQTPNEVRLMRVSRDGRWLASLEKNPTPGSTLVVWHTEDWSRCWETQVDGNGLFDGGRIEFLNGDSRLAVGSAYGKVTVLETATGDSVREISVHSDGISDEVTALAYVPASHLLAVGAGYGDSKITLWNPDTGERVRELTDHRAHIPDLAVSPDGRWLASASADQTIRLWDTITWDCLPPLRGHEDEVCCLTFTADGKRLLTGDKDGSVRIWPIPPPQRPPAPRVVPEPCGILRLSPDSQRMVTFWPGGEYVVWDMNTGEKPPPLTALRGSQGLCQFSADGQQLLVGGPTGKVRVWDFARNTFWTEFDTGRPEETHPLICVPGTNLVLMEHLSGHTTDTDFWRRYLSAGPNRYYTLWQYEPGRLVTEFPHLGKTAQTCNLSSRGDFALVLDDGSFSFQRTTPTLVHTNFWPHRRGVSDVSFTPDGSILATAGDEGLVRLWEAATLREIAALKGHLLSSIWALDISADGRRLATAGPGSEAVKLWDIQTHHELITLTIQGWAIARIEFSRDGNKLVGQDTPQRHLHIWRAPSWEEIAAAEAKEKRP